MAQVFGAWVELCPRKGDDTFVDCLGVYVFEQGGTGFIEWKSWLKVSPVEVSLVTIMALRPDDREVRLLIPKISASHTYRRYIAL